MLRAFVIAIALALGAVAFATFLSQVVLADEHMVKVVPAPVVVDGKVKIESALPFEAPVSVVAVSQCNQLTGIYATMNDGTLLAFDMSSGIPIEKQVEWAQTATGRTIVVASKCVIAPGEFKDL